VYSERRGQLRLLSFLGGILNPITMFALFGIISAGVTCGEIAAAMILGMFPDADDEEPMYERWDSVEDKDA